MNPNWRSFLESTEGVFDGDSNELINFGDAAGDTVTGLTTLAVSGTGTINTSTVTTSGAQTWSGAVTLGADTTLTASTANTDPMIT